MTSEAINPIKLPKDMADFVNGSASDGMQRAEDLLNALQNLKVQITVNGTTRSGNAVIQIAGDQAVIVVNL